MIETIAWVLTYIVAFGIPAFLIVVYALYLFREFTRK